MKVKENEEKDQSCGDGSEEGPLSPCESWLLYTYDAADELTAVVTGGWRVVITMRL